MEYISHYQSPLGKMLIAADDEGLTGLWFCGQRYFALSLSPDHEERDMPVFHDAKRWLDTYFSGTEPLFPVPLHIKGTAFQREVCSLMLTIPYGQTMTYGEIAAAIAGRHSIPRMSARAAGYAVGHNAISIIIPCHRVVGAGRMLTGYAGGLQRKMRLLELEDVDITRFHG